MNRILSVRPGNFELGIPILPFVQEFTAVPRLRTHAVVFEGAGIVEAQYAPTGAAARAGLAAAAVALRITSEGVKEASQLLSRYERRGEMVERYVDAYRRYCWIVHSLTDLKLAPFHVLASEGVVYLDEDHGWHMELAARLGAADPELFLCTPGRVVDLGDNTSQQEGIACWEKLTATGEFALGIESLQRFVEREPFRRVHECVFSVLVLESEPVDPRL